MKLYFKENNPYILHLPVYSDFDLNYLFDYYKNLNLTIDNNISVIAIINNSDSFLKQQAIDNNLPIIFEVESNIINRLQTVNTKYTLIFNCYDAFICRSLDENFIKDFKKLRKKYITSGLTFPYGSAQINEYSPILNYKGVYKYIDSSICFGYTKNIKKLYQEVTSIIDVAINYISDNDYLQYNIDKHYINNNIRLDYVTSIHKQPNIESEGKFFIPLLLNLFKITEKDSTLYLSITDYNIPNMIQGVN